ncbi:MAG: HAD-IIA family hydrolase [Candidatus Nanopelagicales bacterium]
MNAGSEALVAPYDILLFDLDGVLYIGDSPVAYAARVLNECRSELSKSVAFITNNASRTPAAVVAKLVAAGVDAQPEDVVTSAQAAAHLLSERHPPGSAILVVGGEGLVAAVQAVGMRPVRTDADGPVAVVQGFHPDVNWRMLAEAAAAVNRGVPWVVTNRDMTIPTASGIAPGNGALVAAVQVATDTEPTTVGKPEPPLVLEAMRRTGTSRPLMIGDRMDTDIQAAFATGSDSLMVLTGVNGPLDYCLAPPVQRPTFLARDLRALLAPAIVVSKDHGQWSCAGWRAEIARDSGLRLTGRGADPLDGIKVLAAGCWEVIDRGVEPSASTRAIIDELAAALKE